MHLQCELSFASRYGPLHISSTNLHNDSAGLAVMMAGAGQQSEETCSSIPEHDAHMRISSTPHKSSQKPPHSQTTKFQYCEEENDTKEQAVQFIQSSVAELTPFQ
jgi:hypothetical protein